MFRSRWGGPAVIPDAWGGWEDKGRPSMARGEDGCARVAKDHLEEMFAMVCGTVTAMNTECLLLCKSKNEYKDDLWTKLDCKHDLKM